MFIILSWFLGEKVEAKDIKTEIKNKDDAPENKTEHYESTDF